MTTGPARADRSRLLAAAIVAVACAACGTKPPPPVEGAPPETAHHRGDRFQNRYAELATNGTIDYWRWKFEQWRDGLPPPPSSPVPVVPPDRAFLDANAKAGAAMRPSVTWIGHATALVQMGGIDLLTDPIFSERASPLSFAGPRRKEPPGLAIGELPRIDVVLVSHNHYDHCDLPSLVALSKQPGGPPLVVVPLGVRALLVEAGVERVVELDWWQSTSIDGPAGRIEIVMTPVQHWSGRRLDDRMKTLWGGYAVFAPDFQLFFSGDAGYSRDFADVRERFAPRQGPGRGGGFDLALLPIGAYEPRWFMKQQHMNPAEALQAAIDLGAKTALGIHWGTFELTDEALDRPPRDLAAARTERGMPGEAFFVLPVGGTRELPKR